MDAVVGVLLGLLVGTFGFLVMRNPMRLVYCRGRRAITSAWCWIPRCGISFAFWEFCCAYSEAVFSPRHLVQP